MIINKKTIEKLRQLINEETEYRSGPKLVHFFNELGSKDIYGRGFPSRWEFTDAKLEAINGKPEIDRCIKMVFQPLNFIGKIDTLDNLIKGFNEFLVFDGWQVVRNDKEITFAKAGKIESIKPSESAKPEEIKEDDFLKHDFKNIDLDKIGLQGALVEILNERITEIQRCISSNAPLSVVFLCGSSLEGILLGIALNDPKLFNTASTTPMKDGKPKQFYDWSLANFIDVACELNFIKEDVKKFSHSLRDFRNYIHPYEQMSKNFSPDIHTAKISWQVLKAAIFQLSNKRH